MVKLTAQFICSFESKGVVLNNALVSYRKTHSQRSLILYNSYSCPIATRINCQEIGAR